MAITINEAIEGLKGSDALIGRPIAARVEEEKPDDNKEIAEKLNAIQRAVVGYLNQANKNIIAFTKQTRNEIRKQDAELLQVSDTVTSIKIAFKGLTEKTHRLEYRVRNLTHKQQGLSVTNLSKYKSGLLAAAVGIALSALIPLVQKIIEWFTGKKPSAKSNTDDAQAEKKDGVLPDQTDFKVESNLILIDAGTTIDITVTDTLTEEAKNILLSADEILLESGELLFSNTPIIGDSCEGIADTWEVEPDEDQQTTPEGSRKEPAVGGGATGGGATGGDIPTSTLRSNLNAGIAGATGDLSSQLGIGSIGDRRLSGGGGGSGGGPDENGKVSENPPQYDPTQISKETLFDPISSKNFMGGVGGDSASRGHGAHQGEDWGAPVGTPVYAVRDGCIVRHSRDNFGKLVVVIRHDDGTYTRDMHLQEGSALPVGTRVKGGQKYALSGTANGVAHLHHERWSGPPNKSQLLSPSQEAGRSRKDGMVGGQARQGGQIIQPDVAKPTTGQVSDIPAKEVGTQQYASTDEDTSIPQNATLTEGQLPQQGQVLSDATPDNVQAGQQYAGLTTTDKSADTIVAARDQTVGTTDAAATNPNQPAPASPAEKGVLKTSPGALESILRGFFGRPRTEESPPIPKGQQIVPISPLDIRSAEQQAQDSAPTPVEPPAQTASITPPSPDPPPAPEPPKPVPAPAPAPAPAPPKPPPETEVPATTSNPEQETQAPNSGSYGEAPASRDHNSSICII